MTDQALITQVVVFHSKRAFEQLVMKYQSPVRRFFLNHTHGDTALSDDLAQDTFLKVYSHLATYRGSSAFSTWVYRIAYNVFLDYQRRQHPKAELQDKPSEKQHLVQGVMIDIHSALAQLSSNERTCITLQIMEGQTIEAIAEITSMPQGSVKAYLSRGKQKLATFLRNNGYDGK